MTTATPGPYGVDPRDTVPSTWAPHQVGDLTKGVIPVDEWRAASHGLKKLFITKWTLDALHAEGIDPYSVVKGVQWLDGMLKVIALESGAGDVGDPNAVNMYDENWPAHPSIGLAQVIGPTAEALGIKANLLTDPVWNLRASIRTIKQHPNGIADIPEAHGQQVGYSAQGGPVPKRFDDGDEADWWPAHPARHIKPYPGGPKEIPPAYLPNIPFPDPNVDPNTIGLKPMDPGAQWHPGERWGIFTDPDTGEKLWGPMPQQAAEGGSIPLADVPGIDINPVPPGSGDKPVPPPEGEGPSSDWVPSAVPPGVGPGPGGGPGLQPGQEPSLPDWWRDIIEHGGPGGGHLKAPWWWIGSQWGEVPPGAREPTPKQGGGSAVQMPLFTDEGPQYADAAYAHNAPFAQGAPYRTVLPPDQERRFRQWLRVNNVEFRPDDPKSDYDMRGYWREKMPSGPSPFYTDTYKTPYDTTFSNLSQYATPSCPFMWKDGATLIDIRDGSVVFFNPSHYASEEGTPPGAPPFQTPPFAPPDVSASGYGSRWHFGVRHTDGSITNVPLTKMFSAGGETHWDATIDRLRPGEELVVIEH